RERPCRDRRRLASRATRGRDDSPAPAARSAGHLLAIFSLAALTGGFISAGADGWIGFTALAMPAMTGLAMASAPKLRHGLSAGIFNTSRQAGGALGVAVL